MAFPTYRTLPLGVTEQEYPASVGKPLGEAQLGRLGVADHCRKSGQVMQAVNPVRRGTLKEEMEQVRGTQGVIEGTVTGAMGQMQAVGEGRELVVGRLVAQ